MVKPISIIFILFLLIETTYSQKYFENNTIVNNTITYNSLPKNGFGRKIFNRIALENNISIYSIKLETKSRLIVRILRDANNKLIAKISLTRVNIDGNTYLHDFNIDSLLWPSGFTAKIKLTNNNQTPTVIDISSSTNGKVTKVNLNKHTGTISREIKAEIFDIKFNYNESKSSKFQRTSETINNYYSYNILISNFIKQYSNNSQISFQNTNQIFINKILIDRLSDNISNHNFVQKLNLTANDPINFLKLTKKLKRLSNRTQTLFNQQLSKQTNDSLSSPLNFCSLYCNTSLNCINEAKTLQPSDAFGYIEIAKINSSKNENTTLIQIENYYSAKKNATIVNISQAIFNEFVKMSDNAISNDNYSDALLFLNNSLSIHTWFNTALSDRYSSLVANALDGVSSSYLRVGDMALSADNPVLANTYFKKADNIVLSDDKIFNSLLHSSDTAFNNYLTMQYNIAMKYIANENFNKALKRLSYGSNLCAKINNMLACRLIDSAKCLALSGKNNIRLDNLDSLISVGQYPDAYNKLATISKNISNNNCHLTHDSIRFSELSYALFLEFLQQGEILFDAQQSEMALYNLLKAKSIENNYLNTKLDKLSILIKFATEPKITKLIDEAKYHTWANRMDKANITSKKAKELTKLYFGETNTRINNALKELDTQITSRKCVSIKIKYEDAIKKINIAIKHNKYNKLNSLLLEAKSYITNNPNCNIDNKKLLELRNKYSIIIEFYNQYDSVKISLFERGYKEVIERYVVLSDFYKSNNLKKYNISFPNIKNFILTQNLPKLTMTTAKYYVDNNNADLGFDFVEIYKNQGGNSKNIKYITNKIAKDFALRDDKLQIPTKDALSKYTKGDNWYTSFKITYIKNRIVH